MEESKFAIKANDSIMRDYANLPVEWQDMICEAINNSVQAADDNNVDLNMEIDFNFNDNNQLTTLRISDSSGGISKRDIGNCLTPSFKPDNISLSEHGLGLNFVIEFFTGHEKGEYQLNSYHPEGAFVVNEMLTFGDNKIIDLVPNRENHGLELIFNNLENYLDNVKFPHMTNRGPLMKFWTDICAKYRLKHEKFKAKNREFNITISLRSSVHNDKIRIFEPIAPCVINASNKQSNNWILEFTLTDTDKSGNDYEIYYKLGVADPDEAKYNRDIGTATLNKSTHPYGYGTTRGAGFDTFYQDVIIENSSLKIITDSLTGANRITYGDLRGEIHIIKGGQSFFTKNGTKTNPTIASMHAEAVKIFKGKLQEPSKTAPKLNYIKSYVERKSSISEYPSEKIIKHRHKEAYKELHERELQSEANTYVGRMDMIDPGVVIYEHKAQKSKVGDVGQLHAYLRYNDNIPKGVLYAPEHSDEAKDYAGKLNADFAALNRNQTIELKVTPQSWLNTSPTNEEKNL